MMTNESNPAKAGDGERSIFLSMLWHSTVSENGWEADVWAGDSSAHIVTVSMSEKSRDDVRQIAEAIVTAHNDALTGPVMADKSPGVSDQGVTDAMRAAPEPICGRCGEPRSAACGDDFFPMSAENLAVRARARAALPSREAEPGDPDFVAPLPSEWSKEGQQRLIDAIESQAATPAPGDEVPVAFDVVYPNQTRSLQWASDTGERDDYDDFDERYGEPKSITPLYAKPSRESWCSYCGCGNDAAGYAHLPTCTRPQSAPSSSSAGAGADEGFYIATFKHGTNGYVLWWCPNNAGYTTDLRHAGIYATSVKGYHDSDECVPVPVAFAKAANARTMIDQGDAGNHIFHSAEKLRAAIAAARKDGAP